MQIKENLSLKSFNTFGIDVKARYFASCTNSGDVRTLLAGDRFSALPLLILGGGSNILFTKEVEALVLKLDMHDIRLLHDEEDHVILEADAGVVWDDFVRYCVERNYNGVENLALIPGTCGASPIQNIGAYGAEVKDVIHRVVAIHRESLRMQEFTNAECRFGYRDSIFKQEARDKNIIVAVQYKLSKVFTPNIRYGAIQQELQQVGAMTPTVKEVYEAVCRIRSSKLPDPAVTGNAGSFFKNPYITEEHYQQLIISFPELVAYAEQGKRKVAAGWLIEQCGMKGYRQGDAGVHDKQALVLVNYGSASGADILALAKLVQEKVKEKFGIAIETEVNIK